MREYKIYYDGTGPDTVNFKKFAKEIETEINNDPEKIGTAKDINRKLAAQVKGILDDEENAIFAGSMIIDALENVPRYSYIKEVKYQDTLYDVEIDYLERKFSFHEI